MGRKVAFDHEVALKAALKCFWIEGYDKTSLEDLLQAMQIKTSSFYNSFESKEKLFFECLQHYRQSLGAYRLSLLKDEKLKGSKSLELYFDHLIYGKGKKEFPTGCFMMKTAANLKDPDSNVGEQVATAIGNLERGFSLALNRGKSDGSFAKNLDVDASAKALLAVSYGLSVLTRTKKTKKELLNTAMTFVGLLVSRK